MLGPLGSGTLAKPCLAALGLVLILGQTSGSEDDPVERKGIAAPGALEFELRQSVSTSEQSIFHTQAGFGPDKLR